MPGDFLQKFFKARPFSSVFFGVFLLFLLGSIGLECVKIDVRFLFMTGDMTAHPIGPFPTIFGHPYPDYPSTCFVLSWLASLCGHMLTRWSVTLPSMVLGAYAIAMTMKIGERAEKGLGIWAVLLSLLSFEYFNTILGFGIDLPVCAAGVTMLYLLQDAHRPVWLDTLIFAVLLAVCFAVRGPMGPVLLGAGAAGWLVMAGRWKTFFAFAAAGAVVLSGCVAGAYVLLHACGGRAMWDLFYEWQFGNRMDGGSPTFYLLGSIPTYAPLSLPFVYALITGKRALLKAPAGPWLGWLLAIEILLTIPGCQHTRYMTIAVPAIALVGAWGILHGRMNLSRLGVWKDRLFLTCGFLLDLVPFAGIIGLIVCLVISFFFVPAAWVPYNHYLGGILLTSAAIYFFRNQTTWPMRAALASLAMAFFLVMGIIPVISAREDSRPFIEAVEQVSGSDRVFFFDVNADHDGIKYLAEVSNSRRRNIFFIADEDQETDETYAYQTVPQGFSALKHELLITRETDLPLLELTAASYGRSVFPEFTGKLGHKEYVAVRLSPAL